MGVAQNLTSSNLAAVNRDNALTLLENDNTPYDIIIIGGGATGLGAAVDAASRGHRTLLIEQADFAKGTSSRSTKLVHGGVRYLQQGNISLVQEALRERGRLYQNAPHLVNSMAFVIPNYKWWQGPFYGIGMKVYDGLAGKLGLESSEILSREETIKRIPTVETEGLTGGVVYHDGQFDDARLAINLAQTATEHGATVINYMKCVGLMKENSHIVGIQAQDEETGAQHEIRGKVVINCTGVFSDSIRHIDDPDTKTIIATSQGIHIVLPKSFLPNNSAIMIPKTADGRVLFAVPWHGCVVVGTTDTPVDKAELEPRALQEERDFLMEHAALYLTADPKPSDVLSIYAGLRPLVKSGDSSDTAAISRDHSILISDSGLITVAGGKWTTYRKMGEDTIDQAETASGLDHVPCKTKNLKIFGWQKFTAQDDSLSIYGSAADSIREISESTKPIHPKLKLTEAEIRHHARSEMARTVEDVLARRSRWLLLDARSSIEAAPNVAKILAQEIGENSNWETTQIETYQTIARGYCYEGS